MGLLSRFFDRKSVTLDDRADPTQWVELGPSGDEGFWTYRGQILHGYADNPYVMRCVDLIGNAVASLEPILYDEEGTEVQEPRLRAVLRRPNPIQGWQEFAYERTADLNLNGNLYALPIITVRGVEEVWGIPPDHVSETQTGDLMHPVRMWQVSNGGGAILVEPSRMIHAHKKVNLEGIRGISPLTAAGCSIQQQTESRRWNLALMKNGAKPSIVVQDPQRMT